MEKCAAKVLVGVLFLHWFWEEWLWQRRQQRLELLWSMFRGTLRNLKLAL